VIFQQMRVSATMGLWYIVGAINSVAVTLTLDVGGEECCACSNC